MYLIPNHLLQTGDTASAKILAKEVVHSRKAVSKIYTAKANLKSVEMQMKGQAAQVRVAGSLSKSADVMKAMNQLIKVPEIQKTMQEMSKEMMKVCTSNFCNIHLYIQCGLSMTFRLIYYTFLSFDRYMHNLFYNENSQKDIHQPRRQ